MVRTVLATIETQKTDPLNNGGARNIRNTPKRSYNCGGFALECYSWYCPRPARSSRFSYGFFTDKEAKEKTKRSVQCMLADFPDLRVISSLDEVRPDEYAILFRHSSDGDFHFLKRGKNGVWYHKMGGSRFIEIIPKSEIFNYWGMWGRYDGPIVIFAKKRKTA